MLRKQLVNPFAKQRKSKCAEMAPRLMFTSVVLLVVFFMYANTMMLTTASTTKTSMVVSADERHPDPSSFSKFEGPGPTPKSGQDDWQGWADPSFFGSYQYSSTSSIHFPYDDLETFYEGKAPEYSLRRSFPRARYLAKVDSPDSDFCMLTRKGNKLAASGVGVNQDRSAIVSPFLEEGSWWLGLFDGHGNVGEAVAHLATLEFPKQLHARVNLQSTKDAVVEQLRQIVLDIHQQTTQVESSGSTGISMLKMHNKLYISNVGDSEAIIASYDNLGNIEIIYTTKPHKPDLPEERERIEAAGGTVIPAPLPGFSARMLIDLPNGMQVALAMSRSIGDAEADSVGHSAEPTTDILELDDILKPDRSYMAIAASDGLFDKLPMKEIAAHIAKSLLPRTPTTPLEASEQLILKSSEIWMSDDMNYRDDISIVVHKLRI